MAQETVLIGCKLPHGVQLRVKNTVHVLKGVAVPAQARGNRPLPTFGIVSSAALTSVPKDFWDSWKALHGTTYAPFVKGFIFEAKNRDSAKAEAREKADEKTGLEPVDPSAKQGSMEVDSDFKKSLDKQGGFSREQDFSSLPAYQSEAREVPPLPKVQSPVPVMVQIQQGGAPDAPAKA